MKTKLERVTERAKSDPKQIFNCLANLITPDFMLETWIRMNKKGAAGIDEETALAFDHVLLSRIVALHGKLKAGTYKAPAVRRVEIPKDNGKVRKLGIPTVEDRLLQASVARILNAVYEPIFLDCSYGFRPGRKAHDAIRTLRSHFIGGKVMQVVEADIRSYFDEVNHDWLMKMLKLRINDPVILRLVAKWLRAGAFLMPANEIKRQMAHSFTYSRLTEFKLYWKVSKQATIYRAKDLGIINQQKFTNLFVELSRNGERKRELLEVPIDEPQLFKEMLQVWETELKKSKKELAEEIGGVPLPEFQDWLGMPKSLLRVA